MGHGGYYRGLRAEAQQVLRLPLVQLVLLPGARLPPGAREAQLGAGVAALLPRYATAVGLDILTHRADITTHNISTLYLLRVGDNDVGLCLRTLCLRLSGHALTRHVTGPVTCLQVMAVHQAT